MRKVLIILSVLVIGTGSCGQKTAKEFYDKNFKWKITIPKELKVVNAEEWAKLKERGLLAKGEINGEDDGTLICAFNNGELNAFEAVYIPFDPEVDGNYIEKYKRPIEKMYKAFVTRMPNNVVDTLTTIEQIDNLDFYVLKIKITTPNNKIFNMLSYNRLFEKKLFVLDICYINEEIGQKMLNAWKNSTFGK